MGLKGNFSEKITTGTDFIPLTQVNLLDLEQTNFKICLRRLNIPDDVFPEPVISSIEIQCFGTFFIVCGILVAFS